MFLKLLESIAAKDYAAVERLTEKRFFEKLSENKSHLEQTKLTFDLNKLENDDSYIVEKLLVKGVAHDRSQNDSNVDYIYVNQYEGEGLRMYTHKYFLGFVPLYM